MESNVYLNGVFMGKHKDPQELVEMLRDKRRSAELPFDVSITYVEENNEVQIYTDAGRVLRPLIVSKNLSMKDKAVDKLRKKDVEFKYLIDNGIIEYLDAGEEENSYVAITEQEYLESPKYTHIEVTPALITGISAGYCPYTEYNSSPRITMSSAMAKQSLGVYSASYPARLDSIANILVYPQKPLVKTDVSDSMHLDRRPAGQNMVVAVMSYRGYNMEDALILNKSSVDRGLGRSVFYRVYETEERTYPGGQRDLFEIPQEDIEGYQSKDKYNNLDEDGIVFPETYVYGGSVLVGKTAPPRFLEEISIFGRVEQKRREASTVMRYMEEGNVDTVVLTESIEKNRMVKVRTRSLRIPELGDKFASRYGQKGVIGMLVNEEDMPFTSEGIVPDLIINPHAIPSRMTVGHVIEMIGGKVSCMNGRYVNGTAFESEKEADLRKELEACGFKSNGKEVFYDGITGKQIEAEIFVGVIYYQRLQHLVANKIHCRSRGPVQLLTKQPTEGRAKEGGLRFGEMERDCLVGHGAVMMLKDRLLDESDKVTVPVCSKCGMIAIKDFDKNRIYCKLCADSPIYEVEIAYAFKLLMNEIQGLCVMPKLRLEEKI